MGPGVFGLFLIFAISRPALALGVFESADALPDLVFYMRFYMFA